MFKSLLARCARVDLLATVVCHQLDQSLALKALESGAREAAVDLKLLGHIARGDELFLRVKGGGGDRI